MIKTSADEGIAFVIVVVTGEMSEKYKNNR